MADRNTSAVNEADAGTSAEAEQLQEHHHLDGNSWLKLNETVVLELAGEQVTQVILHTEQIVMLEITECVEVKVNENSHYL